jgi:mRNA interferase HigB
MIWIMRLLNEAALARFIRKHSDSRQWLEEWALVVRAAGWRDIHDLRRAYPAADGGVRAASGAKVTIFDVGGNKYRMVADVNYSIGTVVILELITHGEYSKDRWKRRY